MRPDRITAFIGHVLVALQFALMATVAASAWTAHERRTATDPRGGTPAPDAPWLLVAAAALAGWALSANRPGNFNITPAPRPGGELVRHGPYRWIRHPMYAAVLLAAAAGARHAADPTAWAAFAALAVVLVVKASVEERALLRRHALYQEYRKDTARFVPWVF